jgi:hypothetical protein
MTSNDTIIHIDNSSFGIYPLPAYFVEVSESKYKTQGTARIGLLSEDTFTVREKFDIKENVRTNPSLGESQIHCWYRVSASAAPVVLINAIPGFWLNRFRFHNKLAFLLEDGQQTLQVKKMYEYRKPLRQALVQHAASLQARLWSLSYHKHNFENILGDTERTGFIKALQATAEFSAYDASLYGVLEEFSAITRLMYKIISGVDLPQSFHSLVCSENLPEDLSKVLNKLSWYEPFRIRRANTAHAFSSTIHLDTAFFSLKCYT